MTKTKILIVEDDPLQRAMLQELLKSKGDYTISEAGNGREALDRLIDGFIPDLCLVDLNMPEMTGLEFVRRIRRNEAFDSIRIVIASGNHDRKMIVQLAQMGISGYILKPYILESAYSIIEKALHHFHAPTQDPGARNLLGRTLLVVDGDPLVRSLAAGVVASQPGWEITEAADGRDALKRLQGGLRPDLCLVDALLPGIDGLALVQKIRDIPSLQKLRIVAMSVRSSEDTVRAFALLQVEAFLVKPFSSERLVSFMSPGALAVNVP